MKRAIRVVSATTLVCVVTIVGITIVRPSYVVAGLITVFPESSANLLVKSYLAWRERVSNQTPEEAAKILDQQVIRVEVGGRKLNIPMRYTYSSNFEKYGRWPTAKPERIKTKSVSFSVLLPDMKPYFKEDDAVWKALGPGSKVSVLITDTSVAPDWYVGLKREYLSGQRSQFYEEKRIVGGLMFFAATGGLNHIYFPIEDNVELVLRCSKEPKRPEFSPHCSSKSNYQEKVALEYVYSRDYFSEWRQVDSKLKALVAEFEQAALSEEAGVVTPAITPVTGP